MYKFRRGGIVPRVMRWTGGKWVQVMGETNTSTSPLPTDPYAEDRPDLMQPRHEPKPPTGPTLNVATVGSQMLARAAVPLDGVAKSYTKHVLSADVTSVQVKLVTSSGWSTAESGGDYRVWLEGAGQDRVAVMFAGSSVLKVSAPDAAAIYTSDPVRAQWIAGDRITVRVEATAPAGTTVPSDMTGLTTVDVQGSTASMRPAAILAPSDKTSWVVIGDSVAQQPYSYGEQGLALRNLPSVKSAVGGDGYGAWPGRYADRVAPHAMHATHLLDTLGLNETDPKNALRLWKYAVDTDGFKVVSTTINPSTREKVYTETLAREPGVRDYNEWLRDGAPCTADGVTPLSTGTTDPTAIRCTVVNFDGKTVTRRDQGHPLEAVIDPSAAIIDSRTNQVYSAEALALIGSGDSLHPPAGVHALMAKRVASDLQLLGY